MNFVDFYSQLTSVQKRKYFKAKKLNTLVEHGTYRYYSTYRTPSFKHDHWKEELSEKTSMDFQTLPKCIEAMNLLNYSHYCCH